MRCFRIKQYVYGLVFAMIPVLAQADSTEEVADKAYKLYKQSGFISNEIIKESMANIAIRKEDCEKPLNEIALNTLTSDQKSALNPSFLNDFAVVSAFSSARRLWQRFTQGSTDEEKARFFLVVNLAGALRYRLEVCRLSSPVDTGEPRSFSIFSQPESGDAGTTTDASIRAASAPTVQLSAPSSNVRRVTGIDGWEGEIVGAGSPDGKFYQLRIGMKIDQVLEYSGRPDDQSFRAMAKFVSPLSFGPDQYRVEYAYKGVGKLTFSSSGGGLGIREMHLVRIAFDTLETGQL